MKIKKIGSIILAMVMVLTLFSGVFSNLTAFAAEKQMLHVKYNNATNNLAKLGLTVKQDVLTAGEYTVQFKYKFTSGQMYYTYRPNGSAFSNGMLFNVFYQNGTGTNRLSYLVSPGNGAEYVSCNNLNDFTVEYKFNITQAALDVDYSEFYVGFLIKSSVDVYVADMVMYKSGDTTQTNILPETPTVSDWRFYTTWGGALNENPSMGSYVPYDESYFTMPKQMLKLNIGRLTVPKVGIGVAKDKITEGRYTVRFKYNFEKGDLYFDYKGDDYQNASDGAIFAVYSHLADTGRDRMAYFRVRGLSGDYDYTIVDSSTVEYYFNITQADIDDCLSEFYLGFVSTVGSPELYVADMVMYKSDDENQTNLLPEYPSAYNWRHYTTYNIAGLPSGSAYMDYDESLFPEIKIAYGDGNGDGNIDILDLFDLNKEIGNETFKDNYDLNHDGQLTVEDLLILRRHILGIELIA